MKRNFESRLNRIEQALIMAQGETFTFEFTSGDVLEMNEKRFHRMFDSIHERKPNEDVQFFLEQLRNGYEDEGGLVYLIDAENIQNDPERWAELWGDYSE